MRNSHTINFCAPKCTKNVLFCALLIFTHSCCAKINGAQKLMGLRYGPKTSRPIKMQDSSNYSIWQLSWGMNLNFDIWQDIHRSNKYSWSFQVDVVKHAWTCPKLWQIVSQLYLKIGLSCEVSFLHVIRNS